MSQSTRQDPVPVSRTLRAAAFSVHIFTAMGAGIALLALLEAVREHWAAMFAGGRLPPSPIECGSVMVARGLMRESDLLTLLSRDQVQIEIESGLLAAIGAPPPNGRRAIGLSTRENWRPTPTQARLIALLREAATTNRVQEVE